MSFAFKVQVNGNEWCQPNGQRFATREDAEVSARDLLSRWTMMTDWEIVEIPSEEPNQDGPTIKGPGHRVRL